MRQRTLAYNNVLAYNRTEGCAIVEAVESDVVESEGADLKVDVSIYS